MLIVFIQKNNVSFSQILETQMGTGLIMHVLSNKKIIIEIFWAKHFNQTAFIDIEKIDIDKLI